MGQTYTTILLHIIFSTKNRRPTVTPDIRERLHAYMSAVINNDFGYTLRINGPADHVHMLVDARASGSVSDMMRNVKAGSSSWVHETFPSMPAFAWQSGYGAFSMGASQKSRVIEYIDGQEEHHRVKTFQEEFVDVLNRYEIEYDPRYIWD